MYRYQELLQYCIEEVLIRKCSQFVHIFNTNISKGEFSLYFDTDTPRYLNLILFLLRGASFSTLGI